MVAIHYFYDPMCGWCYGATSLIESIASNEKFELKLHSGGMLKEQTIEPLFRQHIMESDQRISRMTDIQFGRAYIERVASNSALILDSYLPTRAILVAESLGADPFDMLKAIQKAHYFDGRPVNQMSTLDAISLELELDQKAWRAKMSIAGSIEVSAIQDSHHLMKQLMVNGYPTLVLENSGQFLKLPHAEYYGRKDEWQMYLESLV